MSSWCSCTGIFGISSYILTENWTHFKQQKSLKLQFSTTSLAFLPPLFKNLLVLFPFDGCRPMYGDPSLPAENRGGQVALDVALLWFEFSEWRQPCPGKNRDWKTIFPIGWGWDFFQGRMLLTRIVVCMFCVITINTCINTTCSMPIRYHLARPQHTFLWDHPCLTLDLGKIYRKVHSFPKDPCMVYFSYIWLIFDGKCRYTTIPFPWIHWDY